MRYKDADCNTVKISKLNHAKRPKRNILLQK